MIYDLQKASMLKRISAYLFDLIMMVIVVVGVASLLSLALGYSEQAAKLSAGYDRYETEYGVDFDITAEEQAKLPQETLDKYTAAFDAMNKDQEMLGLFSMLMSLTLVITSLSILAGHLLLELIVPLIFKNGQTIGKKIFSIALMRTDGVRVNNIQVAIRTILGKFTIETMIPVLMIIMIFFGTIGVLGILILGAVLLIQIIMMFKTETNSCIHDKLANTVVIDLPSQMIFDTEEEMLECKKQIHAEMANRPEY